MIERLKATSAYPRFDKHYRTRGFKYFPSFTIAIVGHHSNEPDRHFTSIPAGEKDEHGNTSEGVHAEEVLLAKHKKIDDIKSILLTSSPCPTCTIQLIIAFWDIPKTDKPVIKFLYFHGNKEKKARVHALNSVSLLQKSGFIVKRWTSNDYMEYLPEDQRLLSDDWVRWRDHLETSRKEYFRTNVKQQIRQPIIHIQNNQQIVLNRQKSS